MKPKMMIKLVCDALMTVAMLLLMAYGMVGEAAHEWIGTGLLLLFICHHILNKQWLKNMFHGKYTAFRMVQTALAVLIFACMFMLAYSGPVLSGYVFRFLPIDGGQSFARTLHMLGSYWSFVLMSVHLGFHWSMMMGIAGRMVKVYSGLRIWTLRALAFGIAGYGVFAFRNRGIGSYLFLNTHFVFFDYEEPLIFFLLDYAAVMGLFVFIGHYLAKWLKWLRKGTGRA